ncbi:hypothetical protein ACNKHO_20320 [Shigella flexneri]
MKWLGVEHPGDSRGASALFITEHVQLTGSSRGGEILANRPAFSAKFALVKPKSSDVKALLGHRSRSAAELRVQAQ